MGYLSEGVTGVGGRRVILALGGLYAAIAVGFPVTSAVGDRPVGVVTIISALVGASGLALFYGGYRLPVTDIRPDLYHVVAGWCVRAVGVMVGVLLLVSAITNQADPLGNLLILSALASVAGLGMGYHDGRAKTRAVDAEEYSRELERYRTIVETVNDGIFVADEDDHFALVNDAYAELVGYDREELLGSPTSLVVSDEIDLEAANEAVERDFAADDAESNTYEATLETAAGRTIDVEWTVAPLPERGSTGHRETADHDGDLDRVGRDGAGAHDRVVVVRDVTERNERERRLERQNERLDSFASLLAHELRNPVTVGQIYGQQLPRTDAPEAVDYVTEAFDRIEDMIDVMLIVARGGDAVSDRSSVRLADVAREVWDGIDAPDATLEVTTDRTIAVDETYAHHLLRNLFENAVEHGSASNRPEADDAVEHGTTSNQPSTDDAVEHGSASNRPEADDVVEHDDSGITVTVGDLPTGFYVADDGVGIDSDERKTVFETGYTTAPDYGGMGLGLTFVREMADVYEWECSVTESDAGGARFEFENVTRSVSD